MTKTLTCTHRAKKQWDRQLSEDYCNYREVKIQMLNSLYDTFFISQSPDTFNRLGIKSIHFVAGEWWKQSATETNTSV
ncbi:unnamed protein product [Clavelina lepadiformis]|uniref:Uncharacterized protein n=1 Tax=Clavelina lepadiformis TaxID=159417 RepID=A0ABP0G8Q8_CLALP